MSLLKSQWNSWAESWKLTHVPEHGWTRRTERLLGVRRGLLIRVMWGTDQDPGLHVLIRFPRLADPSRLRDALVHDTSLECLPASGVNRRKMTLVGSKQPSVFVVGRRPEFMLSSDSLLWRRTFAFRVPSAEQIQSWVDSLVVAVARIAPTFDACESCGTTAVSQFVVVDDIPKWMCDSCQQRVRAAGEAAEREYETIVPQHVLGVLLASVATAIGGAGWAAIGALTQRIFVAGALGIGALVAFAYRLGARRVDAAGRVIGGVLTLASVALGEILLDAWWVAQANAGYGYHVEAGWLVYAETWAKHPGEEILPLLFGLVGAWFAMKALEKPKLAAKLETASEAGAEKRKAA